MVSTVGRRIAVATFFGSVSCAPAHSYRTTEPAMTAPEPHHESAPQSFADLVDALSDQNRAEASANEIISRLGSVEAQGQGGAAQQVVEPLTQLYVSRAARLQAGTRSSLLRLLVELRDPRAIPAFVRAFELFDGGEAFQHDLAWAARASMMFDDLGLSRGLGAAFGIMDVTRATAAYRDVNAAMLAKPHMEWAPQLRRKLDADIVRPAPGGDRRAVEEFRRQLFWQTTAAQVLGVMRDEGAVEPLLKVMLDPARADVQTTAVLALVKIGAPAAKRATQLLEGNAPALRAYAESRLTVGEHGPIEIQSTRVGALVLGVMGRSESRGPLTRALRGATDPTTRAWIARELGKVPADDASIGEFQRAWEGVDPALTLPPGSNALALLTETVATFYRPALVPWLLSRGERSSLTSVAPTVAMTAIKLMLPEQVDRVGQFVRHRATPVEVGAFSQAQALVSECGRDAACYVRAVAKFSAQQETSDFRAIKAAFMVGILGGPNERDALVDSLDAVRNPVARFHVAQTIDHLAPNGAPDVASRLGSILERNRKTGDPRLIQADNPVRQVMYRIDARTR